MSRNSVEEPRTEEQYIALTYNGHRRLAVLVILTALLFLVIGVAVSIGSTHIPLSTTWQVLLSKLPLIDISSGIDEGTEVIVTDIRLPRVILAGIAGAALAVAGAAYQGLFRNPLADPFLMGVASGAGMGAVIAMAFTSGWFAWLATGVVPPFAFLGALTAVGIVYMVSRVGSKLPVTIMILAGVVVAAFFSAISHYLMLAIEELAHLGLSFLYH